VSFMSMEEGLLPEKQEESANGSLLDASLLLDFSSSVDQVRPTSAQAEPGLGRLGEPISTPTLMQFKSPLVAQQQLLPRPPVSWNWLALPPTASAPAPFVFGSPSGPASSTEVPSLLQLQSIKVDSSDKAPAGTTTDKVTTTIDPATWREGDYIDDAEEFIKDVTAHGNKIGYTVSKTLNYYKENEQLKHGVQIARGRLYCSSTR